MRQNNFKAQLMGIAFLFFTSAVSAQVIYGYVYDGTKDKPLVGASVYINGTTIGTITDFDGRFQIRTDRIIKASLIISYVGYETVPVNDPYRAEVLEIILNPKADKLEEVVVQTGKEFWSREKMLKEFKKQFLGATRAGELCLILNEDEIDLWFEPDNKTLKANCDVPIRIRNNYLGYNVTYEMREFEARYDAPNNVNPKCNYVYYEGTSLYKDITQNPQSLARFKINREDEYKGSVLHFFRSLMLDRLKQEGWKFDNGHSTLSKSRVFVMEPNQGDYILLFKRNVYMVYKGSERSLLIRNDVNTPITLYNNGNFSPPEIIQFGGHLAKDRIGNTLPLDYYPGL